MATSNEKLGELLAMVKADRGKLGGMIRPIISAPGIRGQVRAIVGMPTGELDALLSQASEVLGGLVSDPEGGTDAA